MNVENLIEQCYNRLSPVWRQAPWTYLNHGYDIIDSEHKLNAYIAAYGEMHMMKCRMAMQNFPFDDLVLNIINEDNLQVINFELYDWGCGQGIGSLTFMQMLHERKLLHGLTRITLVEPSVAALSRAQQWVRQAANAATEIRVINREIPANNGQLWTDINCDEHVAIHICSNILDVRSVGLKWLAQMCSSVSKHNYFICVGPKYGKGISRISDFHKYLGEPKCFANFAKFPCSYTSKTRHPYGIEAKCFKLISSDSINHQYEEKSNQTHLDEYLNETEYLRVELEDFEVNVYNSLKNIVKNSSTLELYLHPSIGIERPDFILTSISKGVIIINICDDINDFETDFRNIEGIKHALIDTYIKCLKIGTITTPSIYSHIKVGLFFTSATEEEIEKQCTNYYNKILAAYNQDEHRFNRNPPADTTKYLLKLNQQNCESIINYVNCRNFSFDVLQELKSLILGGWHRYSEGDITLRLTRSQRKLLEDETTLLKIRGVAGCGKTMLVAFKAVKEHLRTGQKVLIVTYNISLINYIKMRINQVPEDFPTGAFEIINFHQFISSKVEKYGVKLSINSFDNPHLFQNYINVIKRKKDQYNTIIIDEAQDFMTNWFDCLRNYFLSDNGKMILFGDGEQNIYNREIEKQTRMPAVRGSGPNNKWKVINDRISMRLLNPKIATLASHFAHEFGVSSENLMSQDSINLFDYKMKYWNVDINATPDVIAKNIVWILNNYHLYQRDTVVLGQSINLLREVDFQYREYCGVSTMRTFESKEEYDQVVSNNPDRVGRLLDLKAIRRVSKVHFTTNTNLIKFGTIQSFKGWEAKTIILVIQPECKADSGELEDDFMLFTRNNIPSHLYTAITRARENLFILNMGNLNYHEFFNRHIVND